MKILKPILLSLMLFCFCSIYGQKNNYKDLKGVYSGRDFKYLEDKPTFSPLIAGLGNILYSGVGHFYLREPKRGFTYLRAEILAEGFAFISFYSFVYSAVSHIDEESFAGIVFFYGPMLYLMASPFIIVAIRTLSTIDAIKIAQVKSVAYEKINKQKLSLSLLPEVKFQNFGMQANSLVCGLNLRLTF